MKVKDFKSRIEAAGLASEVESKIFGMVSGGDEDEVSKDVYNKVMEVLEEEVLDAESDEKFFENVGQKLDEFKSKVNDNLAKLAQEIEENSK